MQDILVHKCSINCWLNVFIDIYILIDEKERVVFFVFLLWWVVVMGWCFFVRLLRRFFHVSSSFDPVLRVICFFSRSFTYIILVRTSMSCLVLFACALAIVIIYVMCLYQVFIVAKATQTHTHAQTYTRAHIHLYYNNFYFWKKKTINYMKKIT